MTGWGRFHWMAALVVIFLAGCSGQGKEKKRELVYAGVGDPNELAIIERILGEFELANPEYRVRFVHIPGNTYWTKVKIMFAGGVGPDVLYMGGGRVQELAAAGQLLNVYDMARRVPGCAFDESQFVKEGIDAYRWNGGLYGIPRDVAPIAVVYNKDMFDAAGLGYPRAGWTREEFLADARKLTNGRAGVYGTVLMAWEGMYLPAIWQAGGRVLSADKTQVVVNSPAAIDGLRFMQELVWKEHVAPVANQLGAIQPFNAGRVAMQMAGYWQTWDYKTLGFRWGVVPPPRGPGGGTTLLAGTAYSISSHAKDPIGAWKLAMFMAGAGPQREAALGGLAVPARVGVLSREEIERDPVLAGFMACLKDCRPSPFVPQWNEAETLMNRRVEKLLLNLATPSETARGMAADWKTLLEGR